MGGAEFLSKYCYTWLAIQSFKRNPPHPLKLTKIEGTKDFNDKEISWFMKNNRAESGGWKSRLGN